MIDNLPEARAVNGVEDEHSFLKPSPRAQRVTTRVTRGVLIVSLAALVAAVALFFVLRESGEQSAQPHHSKVFGN